MKMNLSVILLALLGLAGCSKEQFGSTPQTYSSNPDAVQAYHQLSCSSFTLIKPKVDILYVVDNSSSTAFLVNDIKNAVRDTVNTVSTQFDYRLVGINLIPDSTPYNDYQIMTNSQDALPDQEATSRKVISSNELNFFASYQSGPEKGLSRVISFINNRSGLFRQNAYLLIVLISNGRDSDIETQAQWNEESIFNQTNYTARLNSFKAIKQSKNSMQLRLISATAGSACQSGWFSSRKSYAKMSNDLYDLAGATDSPVRKDFYDLCEGGISSVFGAVNDSIQQVVLPHQYKFWPITFTDGDNIDISKIKVYKSSPSSSPQEMTSGWEYYSNASRSPVNTRVLPTSGEPSSARHMIQFTNNLVYPECVVVTSQTKTEYFHYVVLPQEPKDPTLYPGSITLRINGQVVPSSPTNGWSYAGSQLNVNIKAPYPANGDELPAIQRSGFMLKINGSSNYYKSGDHVEAIVIPAGI